MTLRRTYPVGATRDQESLSVTAFAKDLDFLVSLKLFLGLLLLLLLSFYH